MCISIHSGVLNESFITESETTVEEFQKRILKENGFLTDDNTLEEAIEEYEKMGHESIDLYVFEDVHPVE
jgi:uncharacterized tellurite resistance protein B-like protein